MSQSHTRTASACRSYRGEIFSSDCRCEDCGHSVADHADQQHYCEDCKGSHYGDHSHCDVVSDEKEVAK